MRDIAGAHRQQLLAAVADHLAELFVNEKVLPVYRSVCDANCRLLERGAKMILRRFAIGDVIDYGDEIIGARGVRSDAGDRYGRPDMRAVFAHITLLA